MATHYEDASPLLSIFSKRKLQQEFDHEVLGSSSIQEEIKSSIPELDDSGFLEEAESDAETVEGPKSAPSMSGKQMGSLLFSTDKNSGQLMGQYLPTYKSCSWPPHFRSTVGIFRKLLSAKLSNNKQWSKMHLLAQQTYFNKVMELDKVKAGSGSVFRYYKVSQLSDRCWELADSIMSKIESGHICKNKRKKTAKIVYQTSFDCLDAYDVMKDEEKIFNVLALYEAGDFMGMEACLPPRKKRHVEDKTTSSIPLNS